MGNCVNCGKSLTFLNETYPLWDGTNERLCYKCRNKISSFIDGNTAAADFEADKHHFIEIGFTSQGLEYLRNYYEYTEGKGAWSLQEKKEQEYIREKNLKDKEVENRLNSLRNYDYDNHLMTTGYNFDGYVIRQYLRVISGEVVMGTGFLSELNASFSDFFGVESDRFAGKLSEAKQAAIRKLIGQSLAHGGNAIIGVDFDYINFSSNMIGVVANGTCVVVEKLSDPENNTI